jgi:hypothetical protein
MNARMHRTLSIIALAAAFGACKNSPSGPATGSLAITVAGLPTAPAVPAAITVTGVGGYNQAVTGTVTLSGLAPGGYTIASENSSSGIATYSPTPASMFVNVTTSGATATVTYVLASGAMSLSVSGLPGGVLGNVLVTGPAYSRVLTGPTELGDMFAGNYTITGNTVVNGTTTYGGTPFTQTIAVPASLTPVNAAVAYSAMTGQIPVTVSGLPGGSSASILVTGPFAYSHAVTASGVTTLTALPLGDYTVTSDSVAVGPAYYFPQSARQTATLNGGTLSAPVAVTYATPDMSIDGMYITQATQSYTGAVPLVASRDGYLRVFVKANHANTWTPPVRVRWYVSGSLVRTDTIPAPAASVPVSIVEGSLSSSWNLPVPKTLIQPGLSVLADVDPGNVVSEGDETNNTFPAGGTPLTLNVRTATPAHVTLVPVMTSDGRTGMVNAGNMDSFLTFTQKVHPIPSYVATLHATYTTTAGPLQSGDGNGAWSTIINELDALRTADGVLPQEHYYGVVDPSYSSGIAGLGFVGGPTAMGWDKGINDQILAHEIGHNWNRNHAPCGGPAGVDPGYPYPNAALGVEGFDVATLTIYGPNSAFDLMSYCHPYWVSDYTYEGVMAYRVGSPDVVAAPAGAEEPVLLVWGRMRGGELVLEPAFEITARAKVPGGSGAYRIEALDAGGARLFSYAFDAHEVADEPGGARNFAFTIPLSRFDISRLAALELTGDGRSARVSGAPAAATGLRARLNARRAELMWDHASYPMALVRDAHTGRILSFARGGFVRLGAPATDLVVTVSNGVRSTTETVRAQ